MSQPAQLKGVHFLDPEPFDIGLPSDDLDQVLELGDMMAAGRPNLIVFVDAPATKLQKWGHDT